MATRKHAYFKNLSDVLSHLGLSDSEHEAVIRIGFDGVSYGDAAYTLVGNNFALHCILDALDVDDDRFSDITAKYWEVVAGDEFINMEA